MDSHGILEVNNLGKRYEDGDVSALNGVSFALEEGKIYALMGRSGCGKSTLLNLIGQLDSADQGTVLYQGKTIDAFASMSDFRRDFLGFIFQFHHLIPVLTLYENVEMALALHPSLSHKSQQAKIHEVLDAMGLVDKMHRRVSHVSGGERQRTAIARALINHPKLILADEPTGNVDSKTSITILQTLREYVNTHHSTLLIATHDPEVERFADTVFSMEDGQIVTQS